MNCGNSHDNSIHEEIHTDSVQNATDNRVRYHDSEKATGEEVNDCRRERNQEVKDQTEGRRFGSAFKGAPSEGPAGDRLQDEDWLSAAPNVTKNAGIGNIQRAGDQPAQKNRLICSRSFHD